MVGAGTTVVLTYAAMFELSKINGLGGRVQGAAESRMTSSTSAITQAKKGVVTIIEGGKPLQKELDFANELAELGKNVTVRGSRAQGGDFLIDGQLWELKSLESGTIKAVRQNLKVAVGQAECIFVDGRKAGLTMADAIQAVKEQHHAGRLKTTKQVVIYTTEGIFFWTP